MIFDYQVHQYGETCFLIKYRRRGSLWPFMRWYKEQQYSYGGSWTSYVDGRSVGAIVTKLAEKLRKDHADQIENAKWPKLVETGQLEIS